MSLPAPVQRLIQQGPAGVSFFFCLSGFILTYNYFDWFKLDLARIRSFFCARFARVFPMYFIALILITPITLYFIYFEPISVNQYIGVNPNRGQILVSWISNMSFLHVYVPSKLFQQLWNSPSWSVADEVFFYMVFPYFSRYILGHFNKMRSFFLLFICVFSIEIFLFLGLSGFFWVAFDKASFENLMIFFVYRSPFLRIWEFLLGCITGAMFLKFRRRESKYPMMSVLDNIKYRNIIILSLLVVMILIGLISPPIGPLGTVFDWLRWYVLYTPFFLIMIAVIASGKTFMDRLLEHPWIVMLGEASYSLYITHWLLCVILLRKSQTGTVIAGWVPFFAIIVSIMASIVFFKLIEYPARRLLRAEMNISLMQVKYSKRRHQP